MQRINANELPPFVTDGTINKATFQAIRVDAAVYRLPLLIRISGNIFA
jgi:hypothetical protein